MHLNRARTSLQRNVCPQRRCRRSRTVLHNFPADHALARYIISSPCAMTSAQLNLLPLRSNTRSHRHQRTNGARTSHPLIYFHSPPLKKLPGHIDPLDGLLPEMAVSDLRNELTFYKQTPELRPPRDVGRKPHLIHTQPQREKHGRKNKVADEIQYTYQFTSQPPQAPSVARRFLAPHHILPLPSSESSAQKLNFPLTPIRFSAHLPV